MVIVSGLLAALCVTITVELFIPKAVGPHVTSRSISPLATTVSPVAMVVNATTNSALLLVMLETTKAPPPILEPIVTCVVTVSPTNCGIILNEFASKSTVGCGGMGLTSISSKYA